MTNLVQRVGVPNLILLAGVIVGVVVGVPGFLMWRKKRREDSSASLAANIIVGAATSMGLHGQLVIRNNGKSAARDIEVFVNKQPISDFLVHGCASISKTDVIGPGGERSVLIIMKPGSLPPLDVKLTWSDDSGRPRSWRSTIN